MGGANQDKGRELGKDLVHSGGTEQQPVKMGDGEQGRERDEIRMESRALIGQCRPSRTW